jgi:hypothetical protein
MVRGNWQRRVEKAETRRHEAKQKKQRSEDKRLYKNMAQELLGLLDRHPVAMLKAKDRGRKIQLHIWTDSLAADDPPDLLRDDGGGKQQRKARSASMESEEGGNGKKGRGRSNSINEKQSKKKMHPRSKEGLITPENSSQADEISLCKPHFFTGKCRLQGQKGGCRLMHCTISRQKTIYDVCSNGGKTKAPHGESDQISEAEDAVILDEDPDAMEMVYYFLHASKELRKESDCSIAKGLMESLVEKQIGIATIVYAALDDVLIFDRNREGVILSDRDFLITALGDESVGLRRISVGSEGDDGIDQDLFFLPGPVLEYILTFLPDSAVAVASQVCKSWHFEIGQNSPNLWRHLLERREWPLPELLNDSDDSVVPGFNTEDTTHRLFRGAFLQHYAVLRDVVAVQSAVGALSMKRVVREKEMTYQDFSTRNGAPTFPNRCTSVHVWGPNRILASYADDSSLRLFASVAKVGSNDLLCRELICQRVDPYRHTKKRTCQVVAVDLDEEAVGSLCHVMADGVEAEAYIVVILKRDDFLLGEDTDVKPSVIVVGEAVLNYLLSCDEVDHRVLQLIDFLDDGGDVGEVEVLASHSMIACGHGRFMVEVSISIPMLDADEGEGDQGETLHLLARKLVLFSSSVGAIVWMCDSHPLTHEPQSRSEHLMLTCVRRPPPGGSRASCSFAVYGVGSLAPTVIMVGEIEPTGHAISAQHLDSAEAAFVAIQKEGWDMMGTQMHSILVASSDIVMARTIYREDEDEDENQRIEYKSFVSFLPRFKSAGVADYLNLPIPGDLEIVRLSSFRDQHIVAICRETVHRSVETEGLGGQWFSDDNDTTETRTGVIAVILHVPSRREIGRVALFEDTPLFNSDLPQIPVNCEDTVGVGVSWKGLIMTGSDVRALTDSSEADPLVDALTPAKAAKGKKKRRQQKGSKKDEYARGMSLRG